MKLKSLFSENNSLREVELEIKLVPGLPSIQFLGLPDQHMKESAFRIKSAIKSQGFEFPKTKQILVNLRPSHIKKNSKGLELAVAVGILIETGQLPETLQGCFYGELSLAGDLFCPPDLSLVGDLKLDSVYTGILEPNVVGFFLPPTKVSFPLHVAKELKCFLGLEHLLVVMPSPILFKRPQRFGDFLLTEEQAEWLKVSAVGAHSVLLSGPSGTGKTTAAQMIHQLMKTPSPEESTQIQIDEGDSHLWRPFIAPHHSTPKMSLIGGGNKVFSGEIVRAHRGLLLLDEFLEFDKDVIESLRKPMESEKVQVSRLGKTKSYHFIAQIIATTNLCPCGEWTPEAKDFSCPLSMTRCRSYQSRFSGPIFDRFQMLVFTKKMKNELKKIAFVKLLEAVELGRQFAIEKRGQQATNANVDLNVILDSMDKFAAEYYFHLSDLSERRKQSTLRVARSLADLALQPIIKAEHLTKASQWTILNQNKLLRWH